MPGETTFDEASLMDDAQWDYETAEVHEGRPVQRTSFSVRMRPNEFRAIGLAAEAAGMKTGEFIRNAALAAARGESHTDPTSALIALATKCGMRVTFEPVQPAAPAAKQPAAGDSEAA